MSGEGRGRSDPAATRKPLQPAFRHDPATMSDPPSAPTLRLADRLGRLELPIAALVALLGLLCALAWLLQSPRLLRLLPGAPMVLSVALALLATSSLLLLRGRLAPAHQILGLRLAGALTLGLGLAASLEWLTHADLGIDFAPLHVVLQKACPHPGRPSVAAALSLVLLGVGLWAQSFAHRPRARVLALHAFIGVGAIGAMALLAPALGLRLDPAAGQTQALPGLASAAQMLLALALVLAWTNVRRPAIAPVSAAEQVGVWAVSILVVASASITLGALALMQRQIEAEQAHIAGSLIELHQRAISQELAHALAHGAAMGELLHGLARSPDGTAATRDQAWARAFSLHPDLWHDNTSVRLLGPAGRELAHFGRVVPVGADRLALRGLRDAVLFRSRSRFMLQTRVDLDGRGHYLLLQQDLAGVDRILQAHALWNGQQSLLCRVDSAVARCLEPDAHAGPPSKRLLARIGEDDASSTRPQVSQGVTWRGQPGMLASMPVAGWGLRLALVTPAAQAVGAVRAALARLGSLFLVVAALGTWALRGLIQPWSRRLDQALRDTQLHLEHTHTAADTVQEALAVFEAVRDSAGRVSDFRIGYVNAAAAANLGAAPAAVQGRRLGQLHTNAPEARELFERYLEVLHTGRPQQMESACIGEGCAHKWLRRYIMKSGDGVFVIAHDITEARREAHAMTHMALHDPLTGLPNRRSFDLALQRACARAAAGDSTVAVVFCDADDLKQLNDQRGHACGDDALREFARTLRGAVRQDDFVARLAGDEFVVLLELPTPRDALDIVHDLRAAVDREISVCGRPYVLRASIGWAAAHGAQAQPEALLRAADQAMYREKQLRKAAAMSGA